MVAPTIIIGGGFYGLRIALFLYEELGQRNILVLEKESEVMTHASYVNQARIHNGYHYPRSILTAHRSRVNFERFVEEYRPSVVDDFPKYYSIAKSLSKINAKQFKAFCDKIGAETSLPPKEIVRAMNPKLIERTFKVKEYAFNSRILRNILLERIKKCNGIEVRVNEEVNRIDRNDSLVVTSNKSRYKTERVFNCTYAKINTLHRNSSIPLLPLKHEIAEMCLIALPEKLHNLSVTVMDGPFFSLMPFPSTPYHSLSHVRYTPHTSWVDDENTPPEKRDAYQFHGDLDIKSNYKKMYADVVRYIPDLAGMEYVKSIHDVKTTLLKSEGDDSRPILFRPDYGFNGYTCIMGGKLDNIYDVFAELEGLYGEK